MSNQPVNDELTTVAGMASAIARQAESYGIDIVPICKAIGIDPDDLQSLTGRVSLDRICRLFEACALLSNDEAFGLKCASIFTLGSSGHFGHGMMTAPTVRHFLHFLADHMSFVLQVRDCRLDWTGPDAIFSWTLSPLLSKREQYVDLIVAVQLRHLRRQIGVEFDAIAIGLQRQRPQNASLFRERMTHQISYGLPVNSLHIPMRLLDQTNPRGDETIFRLLDAELRTMHVEAATEKFVEQVRRYIRRRIAEPYLAVDLIAEYFGLSERTFQRRLAQYQTTLNGLRDEERRRLSLALLRDSGLPISAIAYRLGYSAPSAFSRSFYRWFGADPKSLRIRHSASDGVPHSAEAFDYLQN